MRVCDAEDSTPKQQMKQKILSQLMRTKQIRLFIFLIVVTILILFGYTALNCPSSICSINDIRKSIAASVANYPVVRLIGSGINSSIYPSFEDVLKEDFVFDIRGHDVIVFLHIQKTSGTSFGRHLVMDLNLERPCICHRNKHKKRCECFRPNKNDEHWLFSRYSTGWRCGLHADWTELTNCVDETLNKYEGEAYPRRYFYITFLRDPVQRYLSEFQHVRRGATWKNSRHWCNGREATESELPTCYVGDNWEGVELHEFVTCPHNLANNRQARMLANLALVGCYNSSLMSENARNSIILKSAKENLKNMAFFGLTEFQKISQYIFEETFNLRFTVTFSQSNDSHSSKVIDKISPKDLEDIQRVNALDIELYNYAKDLLQERFELLKKSDVHFDDHYLHLGELPGSYFSWDDLE